MSGVLHYIGGTLILSVSFIGAISTARLEKKRLQVLDAWITLVAHIRAQIDCYLTPIDRILATVDRSLLSQIGNENAQTSDALLEASRSYPDPEIARHLSAFLTTIGTSYREEELRRCDYYLAYLRAQREIVATSLPARIKAKITLTLCIAVGAVILLW